MFYRISIQFFEVLVKLVVFIVQTLKNLPPNLPQKYGKNIGIKGWGIRILKGKELQYDVADFISLFRLQG